MDIILWIVAAVLIVFGAFQLIDGALKLGIVLVIVGLGILAFTRGGFRNRL